ncbi:MAG TPA: glycosyltransferase [Pseudonocardiaceae bacterium]|nr:glycosyltransferase [Pseudonocardiaceae bacterium]
METGNGAARILIVTAAMGGGHLEVSREVARRLDARGYHVEIVDLTEFMPAPAGRWLRAVYPWLVNRAPKLYDLVYRHFFLAQQAAGGRVGIPVRLALPGLRRHVAQFRPDVAVSTYHLAALALARLRAHDELACPAVTFITTFSVHELWLHPSTDAYLCISDDAAQQLRRRGVDAPVQVCGPVVRAGFNDHAAARRATVRRELGIPDNRRAALVVGGSLGLGTVRQAVSAIARWPGWVPVVVCGRNEALRGELATIPGTVALGWVSDMAGLMAAADVLVENAGGLTSKEALRVGLPVVTFRPITGHGRHDAGALAALGLTDLVDDESGLRDVVVRLTEDSSLRGQRIRRGQALFVGDAADAVASLMPRDPVRPSS